MPCFNSHLGLSCTNLATITPLSTQLSNLNDYLPMMTWQSLSFSRSLFSGVEEVDRLIDSQRRFTAMLAGGDVFYSRTDLRVFIDKCRNEARDKILSLYSEIQNEDHDASRVLVLHAAARLKISALNLGQLIKDYPDLVRLQYPDGSNGSLPLHFAAAAVGSDHLERLEPLLTAYPDAIKCLDVNGMIPMQIALINGAQIEVMKVLVDSFRPALKYPFLPRTPVPQELVPLVGLLPFHIASCRSYSLDVIYQLLVECPDCVVIASKR
jgi:hypothetical protein